MLSKAKSNQATPEEKVIYEFVTMSSLMVTMFSTA